MHANTIKEMGKMNMRYLFIAVLGLWFLPENTNAQSIDTDKVTWTVTSLHDLLSNETMSYSCTFVTEGNSIQWLQNHGAKVTRFSVQSKVGSWIDISQQGKVTYSVTVDGESATLTFERHSGSLTILLDLNQSIGGQLRHRYTVSSTY